MSVPMRAKMTVTSVTRQEYGGESVKFSARYSDNKEDNSYAEATPNAEATFQINNKNLVGKFNPGDQFYVDFVPIAR